MWHSALMQPPKVTLDMCHRCYPCGCQRRLSSPRASYPRGWPPAWAQELLGDTAGPEKAGKNLPGAPNQLFEIRIAAVRYCWGCILRALSKSGHTFLLLWSAEPSKELVSSEGGISFQLSLEPSKLQKLLCVQQLTGEMFGVPGRDQDFQSQLQDGASQHSPK